MGDPFRMPATAPDSIDDLGIHLANQTRVDLLSVQARYQSAGDTQTVCLDESRAINEILQMPSENLNQLAHRVAQAGCVVSDRRRRRDPEFQRGKSGDDRNGYLQSLPLELQEQIAARAFTQIDREIRTGSITVILGQWALSWLIKKIALMFVRWLFSDSKNAGVACRVAENCGLVSECE